MDTTPKDTVDVHVDILARFQSGESPAMIANELGLTAKSVVDVIALNDMVRAKDYNNTYGMPWRDAVLGHYTRAQGGPPRLRRSRQCRGKRSRNYVRALDRTTEAEHTDADLANIVAQAKKSGALANFHREVNRAEDKRQARLRAQAVAP